MMRMIKYAGALLLIVILTHHSTFAQNLKFGHINRDEILDAMPEFDSAQVWLEKYNVELINYLDQMSAELNDKYDAYMKESNILSSPVKQTREQELNDLNSRIRNFQSEAQTQFQARQTELFQSVFIKMNKAIREVGKENGFFYIFNTSQGEPLLYFDESKSNNVSDLVKAKLGLK